MIKINNHLHQCRKNNSQNSTPFYEKNKKKKQTPTVNNRNRSAFITSAQERLYMTGQQLTTHLTTQLTAVKKRNFSL